MGVDVVRLRLKADTFLLVVEKCCSTDLDTTGFLCPSVSWGCSSVYDFQDKNLVVKSLDRPRE